MSLIRSVDATMKNFNMDINGKPVLLDHVKQINIYSGIGIIGCNGDVTMTFDMFKMLDESGTNFSPIGKRIDINIQDNKSGTRSINGIITSFRKIHNVKSSLVIMSFEREEYVRLGKVRWWRCFKEKTIVEMFKEFLNEHGISLHVTGDISQKGTFWETFCIPQTVPTLQFFLSELSKDNLLVFHNPQTLGVNVASWWDAGDLIELNKHHEDYVVDGLLAKFDESKDEWKETTFIFGRQTDTRAPWKMMEWQNRVAPNIWLDDNHQCLHYSALKKAQEFKVSQSKVQKNDINVPLQTEDYSGRDVSVDYHIGPYPTYPALTSNDLSQHLNLGDYRATTNLNIYPRYMFYRMRESYAQHIRWIKSNMIIAGSCKAVVPLTTVMISKFENAMNEDKNELAKKDLWQSGLYMITSCQLMITGNNILAKYDIQKPFSIGKGKNYDSDFGVLGDIIDYDII